MNDLEAIANYIMVIVLCSNKTIESSTYLTYNTSNPHRLPVHLQDVEKWNTIVSKD